MHVDATQPAPVAMGLIARPLAESAMACGQQDRAWHLLLEAEEADPSLDVLDALVLLHPDPESSRALYVKHLEREPSLVAATRWMAGERLEHEELHPLLQRALDQAVKPLSRYRCAACGFEANKHFWQCPGCETWGRYPARRVEEL